MDTYSMDTCLAKCECVHWTCPLCLFTKMDITDKPPKICNGHNRRPLLLLDMSIVSIQLPTGRSNGHNSQTYTHFYPMLPVTSPFNGTVATIEMEPMAIGYRISVMFDRHMFHFLNHCRQWHDTFSIIYRNKFGALSGIVDVKLSA